MSRLLVRSLGMSVDGYAAGSRQSVDDPTGVGGMALHEWCFPTRTIKSMFAAMGMGTDDNGGTSGIDDSFAARGMAGLGAWIIGRNMFGPVRGPWPDDSWKGWWGANPPFHVPVFVLTHHPREPLNMEGRTTFRFVTGGISEAYHLAMEAAEGKDVRVGGGANTIRQYLSARLVDEMHLAIGPALLGSGEHLLSGIDLPALGYGVVEHVHGEGALHVVIRRTN